MAGEVKVVKELTYSYCPHCLTRVPAKVYVREGKVFMEKSCPQHGASTSLVEKDPELYTRLCHQRVDDFPLKEIDRCLIIPVEYRCNLDCLFCFLPNREKENLSLEEIKELVSGFKGQYIELSGGEPTLRPDICEVIRAVKSLGKKCHLATNGLKLTHRDFALQLKDAGLDGIFLSLYGTGREIEEKICGGDVLEQKLVALKVIKEVGIPLWISMTIVPGINEDQIRGIAALAAKEKLNFLTLRSVARVGRHSSEEKFYLSDLLNSIQKALGIRRRELLSTMDWRFTPYFMYLQLQAVEEGKVFHATDNRIRSKFRLMMKLATELGVRRTLFLVGRKLLTAKGISHQMRVRIASWPDKYDADLEEIKLGRYQHVYEGKEDINFFEAIIFNEGL